MVTAVQGGQDRRFKSPFLTKKDDPGMPSIRCSINGYNFQKTLCDTGSGINIMAAVINVRHQHNGPNHSKRLKVIDMGEDEYDPSIIPRRLFLGTVKAIIYIGTGESTCTSPLRSYAAILLTLTI